MNILLVSQCFFPESFRVNDLCKQLVADGNEVTVVTGFPNYSGGEIYDGYTQKQDTVETVFGAEVHRAKIHPRHHGWMNRFLNYVSFARNGSKVVSKLKGRHFDLVFCWQTSPVSQLEPAIKASKVFKAPLVVYCCDLWPESLKAGGVTKGFLFQMVSLYSRHKYSHCDFIINVSPSFLNYHHLTNKIPFEKMNCLLQFANDLPNANKGFEKEPNGQIDILFAGNVGSIQMISQAVEAVSLCNVPNLHLHIVGDGIELSNCMKRASDLNVNSRVHFYGRRPKEDIPNFYKHCDACLLPLSGKTSIGLTLPSKLTEYLAAGKPIIGYIGGDSKNLILQEKLGLVATPDNSENLAKIFRSFAEQKNAYPIWGQRARAYFLQHGTLEIWMKDFYDTVKLVRSTYDRH